MKARSAAAGLTHGAAPSGPPPPAAGDDGALDFAVEELNVQRQLKRPGTSYVWALPKNDKPRVVPLPGWVAAAASRHIETWPPRLETLPWEKLTGRPETHKILFRWPTDDSFVRYRLYSEQTWKPALVAAGVIPGPVKDARGRRRYETSRREGPHQLRHYYASVMLGDRVNIRDLAEYLGHDPAITLRVYGHLQKKSHEVARKAMDARMYRPRRVAGGEVTEQG